MGTLVGMASTNRGTKGIGALNKVVISAKDQAQDAKRREYISNNEYAQKLEELLAYLKRREDALKLGIKGPEYSGGTEESVLLQLNYDNMKLLNKERIFIPYFEVIERYGGRLGNNIPQEVLEKYREYKEEKEDNTKKAEKIMASGFLMLNLLGIDLLEILKESGNWPFEKITAYDLYSLSLLINSGEESNTLLNITKELPEKYKDCVKESYGDKQIETPIYL